MSNRETSRLFLTGNITMWRHSWKGPHGTFLPWISALQYPVLMTFQMPFAYKKLCLGPKCYMKEVISTSLVLKGMFLHHSCKILFTSSLRAACYPCAFLCGGTASPPHLLALLFSSAFQLIMEKNWLLKKEFLHPKISLEKCHIQLLENSLALSHWQAK